MKKLSVLYVTLATIALAGCANAVSGKDPSVDQVTFDSNGGSPVSPITVDDGLTVAKPTDPTFSPHGFVGWYKDGVAYDFAAPVTTDILLTAKWTTTVESKVRYDSSWVDPEMPEEFSLITGHITGHIILYPLLGTFESYEYQDTTAKFSGSYTWENGQIMFTYENGSVQATTTYKTLEQTWEYTKEPGLTGFATKFTPVNADGKKATTVTKTVLETVEQ